MCPVSHITVEDEVNYLRRRAKSLGYKLVAVEAKQRKFDKATFARYPNHMKKWTSSEHEQLLEDFKGGASLEELMDKHQRTVGGIISRLCGAYVLEYTGRGYNRRSDGSLYVLYSKFLKLKGRV